MLTPLTIVYEHNVKYVAWFVAAVDEPYWEFNDLPWGESKLVSFDLPYLMTCVNGDIYIQSELGGLSQQIPAVPQDSIDTIGFSYDTQVHKC